MLKYHLDKILLKFLINISYNIEIVVALMFVMPITVISLAGMLLSYKYKVAEDARSREIPPLRKKSIKNQPKNKKGFPKNERVKIPKKPKKKKLTEQVQKQLTKAELEEIKKTESEIDIEKQKFTCIIHKGPIEGNLY